MLYISSASQVFLRIRKADETKVLRCTAHKLDVAVVQFIRKKKALPWDIGTENLPFESLEAVLDILKS